MSNTIYSDKIKVNCPLICDESGYFHLVYQITNLVNGKIYIGKHSTKDPYDGYMGSGIKINKAIEKYKPENFIKEILFCFDKEEDAFLKEAEIVNLEFVNREDTYNIMVGGNGYGGSWKGERNPMYGKQLSEETKSKISSSLKGKYVGEKNPNFGKPLKQEHKDKVSEALKGKYVGEKNPFYGKHHTQETKNKMSKTKKGKLSGENNPMYGKSHSQETRNKISNSLKGKMTGEKNPNFGKHLSQETKDKMSKSHKGKSAGKKNPMYNKHRFGEENPRAKVILKLDEFGNIVAEYGCIKDCCEQEQISRYILNKLIQEHTLYNGFYFIFKSKI